MSEKGKRAKRLKKNPTIKDQNQNQGQHSAREGVDGDQTKRAMYNRRKRQNRSRHDQVIIIVQKILDFTHCLLSCRLFFHAPTSIASPGSALVVATAVAS